MKRRRKLLSVLLSAALVITMIPAFGITASAEDDVIRTKDGDEIRELQRSRERTAKKASAEEKAAKAARAAIAAKKSHSRSRAPRVR